MFINVRYVDKQTGMNKYINMKIMSEDFIIYVIIIKLLIIIKVFLKCALNKK